VKQWEEDDFYASDEDEFLDRTGSIEKKRHIRMRMAGKEQEVVQTFESLSQKHAETEAELARCEQELGEAVARRERAAARSETSDLDSYVAELKRGAQVDKETVQKLKMKIIHLKQEKEVEYLFSVFHKSAVFSFLSDQIRDTVLHVRRQVVLFVATKKREQKSTEIKYDQVEKFRTVVDEYSYSVESRLLRMGRKFIFC
jgi:protein phosphatase 1D